MNTGQITNPFSFMLISPSFLKLLDIHTMDDHWWAPTSTPGIPVLQMYNVKF